MEWIKVTDKLPEDRKEVLVAIKHADCPVLAFLKNGIWMGSLEVRDFMIDGYVNDSEIHDCHEITHWCELPPLPNGDCSDIKSHDHSGICEECKSKLFYINFSNGTRFLDGHSYSCSKNPINSVLEN